ncbi:hypothetical protein [Streptomyces sp. KLMMK]
MLFVIGVEAGRRVVVRTAHLAAIHDTEGVPGPPPAPRPGLALVG